VNESTLLKYVASEETFSDTAVIMEEGSRGNWVYLVLEGNVKISKKTSKGKLILYTLTTGAIFGELNFLQMSEGERTVSAIADGPVRLGVLDMKMLSKEYQSVSPLLKVLLSNLSRRLQESTEKLILLSTGVE
jgi:CRP-like cAMP-binding protein